MDLECEGWGSLTGSCDRDGLSERLSVFSGSSSSMLVKSELT
jgi:hypothetical protein